MKKIWDFSLILILIDVVVSIVIISRLPGARAGVTMGVCILLVNMVFIIVVCRDFLGPINKLRIVLRKNSKIDMDKFQKEIGANKSMQEFMYLFEQRVEEDTRRSNTDLFSKESQLMALQSQINPHFLYNTLDTIRGRAMLDGSRDVAMMIQTLSEFFRYSISGKGEVVTVRDEVTNIKNYMKIQNYRFEERYRLEISIDDDRIYDYYVPRLILQPIVENAITHGLNDEPEGGMILVDIDTSDCLIITISDNGKGMSLASLDAINRSLVKPSYENNDTQRTGIALYNINKRIQLRYGKRYGLCLYSTEGYGTDVEISLPIMERPEEHTVE